jgi:hypothetical protein
VTSSECGPRLCTLPNNIGLAVRLVADGAGGFLPGGLPMRNQRRP